MSDKCAVPPFQFWCKLFPHLTSEETLTSTLWQDKEIFGEIFDLSYLNMGRAIPNSDVSVVFEYFFCQTILSHQEKGYSLHLIFYLDNLFWFKNLAQKLLQMRSLESSQKIISPLSPSTRTTLICWMLFSLVFRGPLTSFFWKFSQIWKSGRFATSQTLICSSFGFWDIAVRIFDGADEE